LVRENDNYKKQRIEKKRGVGKREDSGLIKNNSPELWL
jgi:hypothetical protein